MKNSIKLAIAAFALVTGAGIATAQPALVQREMRNCAVTLCNNVSNPTCSSSVKGKAARVPNNTTKGSEQAQAVGTCREDAEFLYRDCIDAISIPQMRGNNTQSKETVKKTETNQPK